MQRPLESEGNDTGAKYNRSDMIMVWDEDHDLLLFRNPRMNKQ